MENLKPYMEERSEGVLRLLENGKRRGLQELKKGHGNGTQKELFQTVAVSQHTFLDLHDRCRSALRFAHENDARELALDIQYLLYLFSLHVYTLAFANSAQQDSVSFPPPEAYSRHYPGEGPKSHEGMDLFQRYFGDAIYSREKSSINLAPELDLKRKERILKSLNFTE